LFVELVETLFSVYPFDGDDESGYFLVSEEYLPELALPQFSLYLEILHFPFRGKFPRFFIKNG
jgi:hypothetical protein